MLEALDKRSTVRPKKIITVALLYYIMAALSSNFFLWVLVHFGHIYSKNEVAQLDVSIVKNQPRRS